MPGYGQDNTNGKAPCGGMGSMVEPVANTAKRTLAETCYVSASIRK